MTPEHETDTGRIVAGSVTSNQIKLKSPCQAMFYINRVFAIGCGHPGGEGHDPPHRITIEWAEELKT